MGDGMSNRRRSPFGTVGYYEEKIQEAKEDLVGLDFDVKRLVEKRERILKEIGELEMLRARAEEGRI